MNERRIYRAKKRSKRRRNKNKKHTKMREAYVLSIIRYCFISFLIDFWSIFELSTMCSVDLMVVERMLFLGFFIFEWYKWIFHRANAESIMKFRGLNDMLICGRTKMNEINSSKWKWRKCLQNKSAFNVWNDKYLMRKKKNEMCICVLYEVIGS